MTDLPLHWVAETTKTLTLGWTPIACEGYVFYAGSNRISNTWDASRSSVKFGKVTPPAYRVQALGTIAEGVYPPVVVPPPPPAATYKTRFMDIAAQSVGDDASFGSNFYQQEKAPDRANITTLNGERVLRTRCAVGDNSVAGSGGGERCEIMRGGSPGPFASELSFVDGESFVIGTQFYLDPTFKSSGFLYGTNWLAHCNFVQTHHGSGSGQVPWQLNLCTDDARLGMRIIGGGKALGPYNADGTPQGSTVEWHWTPTGTPYIGNNNVWNNGTPGTGAATYQVPKSTWHTLVMSVKFHQTTGYAKVWVDGTSRFNISGKKIGYSDDSGAYWKQGFYRAAITSGDSIIYWRDLYSFNTEAEALSFVG